MSTLDQSFHLPTNDSSNPAWAHAEDVKFADLLVGDLMIVDNGFECMKPWSEHRLNQNADGDFYLRCSGPDGEGEDKSEQHSLSGQRDHNTGTDYVVGMRRIPSGG